MSIVLYHHPLTRAANVVWMLEEVEVPYTLRFVDVRAGEQNAPELLARNPMGKLPVLEDGGVVVTESAAIALYLADRYALGRLAPTPDDPARGTYLRWSLFAPSVIEPGSMAKRGGWPVDERSAGWGKHERMVQAMAGALEGRPYLLGENFSMADVIFGGTIRYMLQFKMLEPLPVFEAYAERLAERPALKRAKARNVAVMQERGINI